MSTRMVSDRAGRAGEKALLLPVLLGCGSLFVVTLLPFAVWSLIISQTYARGERSTEIGVLFLLLLLPRILFVVCGALPAFILAFRRHGLTSVASQGLVGLIGGVIAALALFGWSRWIAPLTAPRLMPSAGEAVLAVLLGVMAGIVAGYSVFLVSRLAPRHERGKTLTPGGA